MGLEGLGFVGLKGKGQENYLMDGLAWVGAMKYANVSKVSKFVFFRCLDILSDMFLNKLASSVHEIAISEI